MRCLHFPSSNRTNQMPLVRDISPSTFCSTRTQVTTTSPRKLWWLPATFQNFDVDNKL